MIDKIYRARLDPATVNAKKELWDVLAEGIGGGFYGFINAVRCQKKYVIVYISGLVDGSLNIAFASNFFEHLESKQQLFGVLAEIHQVLKRGGKLLIIQPNIKYAYREYWDFIDHHIALTENSLGEALPINGFEIGECILQFLPFSVNASPSRSTKLLNLYLKMPPVWKVFGKQTFMVGVKP